MWQHQNWASWMRWYVPIFTIIILERSYDDIEGKLDEYMSNQHIFLSTPCGINADTSNEYVSPGGHFRKTGSNQSFPYDSLPLLSYPKSMVARGFCWTLSQGFNKNIFSICTHLAPRIIILTAGHNFQKSTHKPQPIMTHSMSSTQTWYLLKTAEFTLAQQKAHRIPHCYRSQRTTVDWSCDWELDWAPKIGHEFKFVTDSAYRYQQECSTSLTCGWNPLRRLSA